MRRILAGVAACALIAGCGSSSSPKAAPASTPASQSTGGKVVAVSVGPGSALMFTQKRLEAKAGKVTFRFTNKASIPHAFAITGHGVNAKGAVVTDGAASLTVTLKPGRYTFYCPVDGHRAAGMQGTLIVS